MEQIVAKVVRRKMSLTQKHYVRCRQLGLSPRPFPPISLPTINYLSRIGTAAFRYSWILLSSSAVGQGMNVILLILLVSLGRLCPSSIRFKIANDSEGFFALFMNNNNYCSALSLSHTLEAFLVSMVRSLDRDNTYGGDASHSSVTKWFHSRELSYLPGS